MKYQEFLYPHHELSEQRWVELREWLTKHYDVLTQVRGTYPDPPIEDIGIENLETTDLPYARNTNLLCLLISYGVVDTVVDYIENIPRPFTSYSLCTEDLYPYGKYPVHYAIEQLGRVFQFKYERVCGGAYGGLIARTLQMVTALLRAEQNDLVVRDAQDRLAKFYQYVGGVEDPEVWRLWHKLMNTHLLPQFPSFSMRVMRECLDAALGSQL